MKSRFAFALAAFLALSGCSTVHPAASNDSETVMVTYRVRSGRDAEFQKLLAHGWDVYRSEQMVFAQPHTIVRHTEDDGKASFVEIFTWVKAPDHAPDSVKAIWNQEQALCEQRNGKNGIEFSEVQLVDSN